MSFEEGPLVYQNWQEAIRGSPSQVASEYSLFSDARLDGEISAEYGPYFLLNTFARYSSQRLLPVIILRKEYHLDRADERIRESSPQDEIAALLSLTLGIRLRAGGQTRIFNPGADPRGRPTVHSLYKNPILVNPAGYAPILPQALGTHTFAHTPLIVGLPDLSPRSVTAIVRAASLYQDATWLAESEPEFSWLLLVSAVETAANCWRAERESSLERLKESRIGSDLEKALGEAGCENLFPKLADILADYLGATKKFIDFVLEFMPEPPEKRPPEYAQHSWNRKGMKESMRAIYSLRSRALHGGTPFPSLMCDSPGRIDNAFEEKPYGPVTTMVVDDAPMPMLLHLFEYIVRNALLKWWKSMLPNIG